MSRIGLLIMSQQLLEVCTLCCHTCVKTATPLVNCFVDDALVHVMPNMQQTLLWFVNIIYPWPINHLLFIKNIQLEMKQWVTKQNKLKLFVSLNWWFVSLNFYLPLKTGNFYTNISQGSVTTHLRRGGIYINRFTAYLLPSLPVNEVWKSVKIWWSYCYEFSVFLFWDMVYIAVSGLTTHTSDFCTCKFYWWWMHVSPCMHSVVP